MIDVKKYIEIILLIILIVCLYNGECELLADMMGNNLGKLFMLGLVILILGAFGKTAGVLAAFVYIFILHQHRREGFEEGASLDIKLGDDDDKKKKKKKENFTEGASLSIKVGEDEDKDEDGDEDEDEEFKNKEGFLSFNIGSGAGNKDGFWVQKNKSDDMEDEEEEGYCSKCGAKKGHKHGKKKRKKEGFANLRQNRNLKLNNISVLNTTDLDRIIKKDSEVRTLNSTS